MGKFDPETNLKSLRTEDREESEWIDDELSKISRLKIEHGKDNDLIEILERRAEILRNFKYDKTSCVNDMFKHICNNEQDDKIKKQKAKDIKS